MAARRSERLAVVLRIAEREEQAAASRLRERRDHVEREQQQLAQLEAYRGQYFSDYREMTQGVDAATLQSYSGFLQRLGDALAGQQQKLAQAHQWLEQGRMEWQRRYHRRCSLEEMIKRLRREELSEQDRRQQRELDDLAGQRRHGRGGAARKF